MSARTVALLVLINVFWAGSSTPAKMALGSGAAHGGTIGPFVLTAWRFAIASVLFLAALRIQRTPLRMRRADVGKFFYLGVFGITVTYGIFYSGLRGATATEASVIISAEPILMAVLAATFLRERMSAVQVAGLAAGFGGVYVIVMQGLVLRWTGTVMANGVLAAAMLFEASATVVGKDLVARYPGMVVVTLEALIGLAAVLPLALMEGVATGHWMPGPMATAGIVYLGVVCSFLCYGIWFSVLPHTDLSSMAGFLFLQPMLGPVFAFVLLHERLGPWTFLGAGLVISGIWMVAVAGPKQRAASA